MSPRSDKNDWTKSTNQIRVTTVLRIHHHMIQNSKILTILLLSTLFVFATNQLIVTTYANKDCTGSVSEVGMFTFGRCFTLSATTSQKYLLVDKKINLYACKDTKCGDCVASNVIETDSCTAYTKYSVGPVTLGKGSIYRSWFGLNCNIENSYGIPGYQTNVSTQQHQNHNNLYVQVLNQRQKSA